MDYTTVEIVKAVAWPLAAIGAALVLYKPLSRFVEAIGARATKLSVFKVEVELASGVRPAASPALENIKNPESALMTDSSAGLFQQVQDATPADYALIDIGSGDEWLTSRLFIGAAMLERMRGVECLVFVGRVETTDGKLLAVAPLRRVRWALAQFQPWLESAFAMAYSVATSNQPSPLLIKSVTGALEPKVATEVVKEFIRLVQNPIQGNDSDWVDISRERKEHAAWVTNTLLQQLLTADAYGAWALDDPDKPRVERAKAVLRRRSPFVALVNQDRQLARLIDRRALLEEVVARMDE